MTESEIPLQEIAPDGADEAKLKKYRIAGIGFLVLNLVYIVIYMVYLPPMFFGLSAYAAFAAYFGLMGTLAWFVFKGSQKLTQILFWVYGARMLSSAFFILQGGAFPAAPYAFPCVVLAFYLLGRPLLNWR
ncbi:MAG: hypothetical protein G3M78_02920 [Candidatus Nitrohelix vancouverensis]|uniref:Uncharacterized protein n=1 Tax=Candidatus Nitrohelix vancouverensis TaxID=2705534 RepID=A0A7T0C0Q9_9BACT|nr:MAG: hypothetical protein G3M78_02920 [Candidatus Nitrohelix vancouverensis]